MITTICLWWIGLEFSAPKWFFIVLIAKTGIQLLRSIYEVKFSEKIREHLQFEDARFKE